MKCVIAEETAKSGDKRDEATVKEETKPVDVKWRSPSSFQRWLLSSLLAKGLLLAS